MEVEALIEKVRNYLAPERDLSEIRALRYEGVLILPQREGERALSLILQYPDRQRLTITGPQTRETVAVDGVEGFSLRESIGGETSTLEALESSEVMRMRTNAMENLCFMQYPENVHVRVRDLGYRDFHGHQCRVLEFQHLNGIRYLRFIDEETGRIVGTSMDGGVENLEIGSQKVDGIRFGEEVHAYHDGRLIFSFRFDTIEINPEVDPAIFSYPE